MFATKQILTGAVLAEAATAIQCSGAVANVTEAPAEEEVASVFMESNTTDQKQSQAKIEEEKAAPEAQKAKEKVTAAARHLISIWRNRRLKRKMMLKGNPNQLPPVKEKPYEENPPTGLVTLRDKQALKKPFDLSAVYSKDEKANDKSQYGAQSPRQSAE